MSSRMKLPRFSKVSWYGSSAAFRVVSVFFITQRRRDAEAQRELPTHVLSIVSKQRVRLLYGLTVAPPEKLRHREYASQQEIADERVFARAPQVAIAVCFENSRAVYLHLQN